MLLTVINEREQLRQRLEAERLAAIRQLELLVNSYKHALEQGLGFLPIIFETTGQMHHETLPFFVTCLEQASRVRQIPFTVLWKYY